MTILSCAILVPALLLGQDTAGSGDVSLPSRAITGVVVFSDGRTPLKDLPIKVWNADQRKMVYRSRTDENGGFKIPRLTDQGRYFMFVGYVKVNLNLLAAPDAASHQDHDIVVVLSRLYVTAAGPELLLSPALLAPQLLDVLIAPALLRPPSAPVVVSP